MARLSLTVEPSTSFTADDAATADQLNLAAEPSVFLEENSVLPAHLDTDALVAAIGDSLRAENYAPVGTFWAEGFLSSSMTCADAVKTPVHPGWWVKPTGAALTAEPAARSAASQSAEGGRTGLKVTGHASLTALEIGTYLPPGVAQILSGGDMTFSIYVRNRTGTSFTPSLKIYCSDTSGDEGAVTLQATVSGTACADSQWTRVEFDFDASAVTNFNNGCQFLFCITAGGGVMNSGSDYLIIADAQIDKGVTTATTLKSQTPPVNPFFPAGIIVPWGGAYNDVPPGFLFCDGSAVNRAKYYAAFRRLGTSYGAGDGSSTFNLPDLRGRTWVGTEIAGSSQSRMETSMTATGTSGAAVLTVTTTAGLRLGMGAYGTGIASGAYIIALTATTVTLSNNLTDNVSGTVRFGKLGASADPESPGAAGTGMSYGRNEVKLTKKGCATATSTTLTVPGLAGLACGMLVSSSSGDIPAGTTIACFLTPTTVRLSAAATGTNTGQTVTFTVDAPEGNEWERYQYLLTNPTILCRFSGAADQALQTGAASELINYLIEPGWLVTGEAGAAIVAGTYVATVDTAGLTNFSLSVAAGNVGAANYELTFSGSTLTRTSTPVPDSLPAQVGNWIVKV